MLYLRSLLFNFLMFMTVPFFAMFSLACFWLPYEPRYHIVVAWQRCVVFLAKKICHVRYEIYGLENLPPAPFVIASNHQSTWETLAFPVIFPNVCYVLKKELLNLPFFGWALHLLEPIAIDRAQKTNAMEQVLKQGSARLQKGRTVIIFPEGKRMPLNQPGQFRSGASILAKTAGVPLVPLTHDAAKCWPKHGWLKRPGIITIKIGKPIWPEEGSSTEIHAKMQEAILMKNALADAETEK
ncbi:MAG: 1-acyl-sn-glycerol-3-phosphate acyltransferase [Gammaproteobacteria bacterium]|nr:1-acyl-sn-glycerol-3-phosphate acyltransferase [Gammaproteobacteria bacterium]